MIGTGLCVWKYTAATNNNAITKKGTKSCYTDS